MTLGATRQGLLLPSPAKTFTQSFVILLPSCFYDSGDNDGHNRTTKPNVTTRPTNTFTHESKLAEVAVVVAVPAVALWL